MVGFPVYLPESARSIGDFLDFMVYLNGMARRWFQGHCQYGLPKRRKKYLSRMKMELAAYEETGNMEHLANIGVYSYLESKAPENPKFHYNPGVDSVTRGKGFYDGRET